MGLFNDKGELGIIQKKCLEMKKENSIQNKKLTAIQRNHNKNKGLADYTEYIENAKIFYQQLQDFEKEIEMLKEDKNIKNFARKVETEKEKVNNMKAELESNIKNVSDLVEKKENVVKQEKSQADEDKTNISPENTETPQTFQDQSEPNESSLEGDDEKFEPESKDELKLTTDTANLVISETENTNDALSSNIDSEEDEETTEISNKDDMKDSSPEIESENTQKSNNEVEQETNTAESPKVTIQEELEEDVESTEEPKPEDIKKNLKKPLMINEEEKTSLSGKSSLKLNEISTKYFVIKNWQGEDVDDLEIKAGEILTLVDTNDDPWWYMRNEKGDEGIVPSNFLKKCGEKTEETTLGDVENRETDFVHLHRTESVAFVAPREKEILDQAIQDSLRNKETTEKINYINLLKATKRLPTHCDVSYFESLQISGKNTIIDFLYPELSPSSLEFSDLAYNFNKDKIASNKNKISFQKIMILQKVRNLNLDIGPDVNVVARHVKFSMYSKNKFHNILGCESSRQSDDFSTWHFTRKNSHTNSKFHPIFFINSSSEPTYLVFEICLTISTEEGEFQVSCGWTKFSLFKDKNIPTANGTHILQLQGGFAYQTGVSIPHNKQRRRSFLSSFAGASAQLVIRLTTPNLSHSQKLKSLPVKMIGSSLLIDALEKYRIIQIEELLVKRNFTENPNDGFLSIYLSVIPYLFDQPDVWDCFNKLFKEHLKTVQKAEIMAEFKLVVIRFLYPLMCIEEMPKYVLGATKTLEKREKIINDFVNAYKNTQSTNSIFLSDISPYSYKPFTLSEINYELLQHYCLINNFI